MKADKPEDFAQELTLTLAGETGRFPSPKAHVGRIIDKQTAIIDTRTNPPGAERNEPISIVVSGIDTSKWADGLAVNTPPGIFVVSTQKRGGTTYLHLVPLNLTKDEAEIIMKAAKP